MIDVGRICVKIAGRDAGLKCVVVEVLDNNFVLIDGETRRRKCNILHLEPLDKTVELKKGASHAEVEKAFERLGYAVHAATKAKPKSVKPRKARKSKLAAQKPAAAPKAAKPAAKAQAKAAPAKAAAPKAPVAKAVAEKPAAKKAAPAVQKKLE
jgi:large subunit ribosomal protein L14e